MSTPRRSPRLAGLTPSTPPTATASAKKKKANSTTKKVTIDKDVDKDVAVKVGGLPPICLSFMVVLCVFVVLACSPLILIFPFVLIRCAKQTERAKRKNRGMRRADTFFEYEGHPETRDTVDNPFNSLMGKTIELYFGKEREWKKARVIEFHAFDGLHLVEFPDNSVSVQLTVDS